MSERFQVRKEVQLDMAHRVPNHKSKCRNLHGHRYKVEAVFSGPLEENGSSEGMVIDFGDIKNWMMATIHNPYDHGSMFWDQDPAGESLSILGSMNGWNMHFVEFIPTAENLAKFWYDRLDAYIGAMDRQRGMCLDYVRVFETPTSVAIFPAVGWH
jgi:6-pyruvoyltetrahydropterin/6-carboxytetrahydropterin synthase